MLLLDHAYTNLVYHYILHSFWKNLAWLRIYRHRCAQLWIYKLLFDSTHEISWKGDIFWIGHLAGNYHLPLNMQVIFHVHKFRAIHHWHEYNSFRRMCTGDFNHIWTKNIVNAVYLVYLCVICMTKYQYVYLWHKPNKWIDIFMICNCLYKDCINRYIIKRR